MSILNLKYVLSLHELDTDWLRYDTTIGDVRIRPGRAISFRIEVPENARHMGGATLFGKGFGNYPQDIRMRMHYAVN